MPRAQKVWSHITGVALSAPQTNVWYSHSAHVNHPRINWTKSKVNLQAPILIRFPGAHLVFPALTYTFPVLGIPIVVKANLSSFNIKFKNCYSLSARHSYKSIRLRNKSQRGFTMKGYLAGELLCSLVSQDFQTSQMDGIPPQLEHSWGRATQRRINQGHFFTYISKYCTPQMSGFDSSDACVCFMFHRGSQSNVTGRNANYVVGLSRRDFPAD